MKIPVISILQRGTKQFPRYLLSKSNEYANVVYWCDDDKYWTPDEERATIYADPNVVLHEHYRLVAESLPPNPTQILVAPLYVQVFGGKPDLDKLKKFLIDKVRIVVNDSQPQEDQFILVGTNFNALKEET